MDIDDMLTHGTQNYLPWRKMTHRVQEHDTIELLHNPLNNQHIIIIRYSSSMY